MTFYPQNAEEAAEIKKRRAFRKFSYRGIDLDQYVAPGRPPWNAPGLSFREDAMLGCAVDTVHW